MADTPLDISGAEYVEVSVRRDGSVLWVNTPEGCVLRICRIDQLVINDARPSKEREWRNRQTQQT